MLVNSFCRQAEVVAPGSKTIAVTVVLWKELLQDVMLAVLDAFEQAFVGVLSKLGRSRVTAAIQDEPNTSTDECFDALFIGYGGEPTKEEKCREQHQDLYMIFIDLTKAFDSVYRQGLWQVLRKIGCPDKFVKVVESFHEGMQGRVIDGGDLSDPFTVCNETKQGCVLAALLLASSSHKDIYSCSQGTSLR